MSKEKDKLIASAKKLAARGQIDKAIKEYQKSLEIDRKDVKTWTKIGDLFSKIKKNGEAIKAYNEAAKLYTRDGFYSKAIAIFKEMILLEENMANIYLFTLSMADLYVKLGMVDDAMSQYGRVAIGYEKAVKLSEALEVYEKMAKIEPHNTEVASRLVDLYKRLAKINYASGLLAEPSSADTMVEFNENADELSKSLMELKSKMHHCLPPDPALVNDAFRAAHLLKGVCGMSGFKGGVEVGQQMEDLLDNVRLNKLALTPAMLDTLFGVTGKLRNLITKYFFGKPCGDEEIQALIDEVAKSTQKPASPEVKVRISVPAVNLEELDIGMDVIVLVLEELCRKHKLIPIKLSGKTLTLAMADPRNLSAKDEIQFLTGLTVEPAEASEKSILQAIEKYYSLLQKPLADKKHKSAPKKKK